MRKAQSRNTTLRAPRSCSGISLIEVLIALVVLSVGMLGIAALYVESLRSGRSALTRSQAVVLAADMGERIRANPRGNTSYTKTADATGTFNAACAAGGGCTTDAMAAHDIAVWHRMVDSRVAVPNSLPGGRGSIAVTPGTGTLVRYTITVTWDESGAATAGSNTYALTIEVSRV